MPVLCLWIEHRVEQIHQPKYTATLTKEETWVNVMHENHLNIWTIDPVNILK